jgi:hypothetical protein
MKAEEMAPGPSMFARLPKAVLQAQSVKETKYVSDMPTTKRSIKEETTT